GHPTLTQQHHLDALALRRRYLPAQRSFQPPHLGFAAFDHLFSPNQMAQANHTSGEENSPRLSAKNSDSSRYGGSIRCRFDHNRVVCKKSRKAGFFMPTDVSALQLVLTADPALIAIVRMSLIVSLSAVLLAALIGVPFGAFLALVRFPGREA